FAPDSRARRASISPKMTDSVNAFDPIFTGGTAARSSEARKANGAKQSKAIRAAAAREPIHSMPASAFAAREPASIPAGRLLPAPVPVTRGFWFFGFWFL